MRILKQAPAILSFALLAFQAVLPWLSIGFVTQDGPSHLYTALVAKDLLLHSNSPYAAVYQFQPQLVTNWCTTIVMNLAAFLFGTRDAEHAVATLCVLLGFLGLAYLKRSLDPNRSPYSPVINFLLFNWFLWIGFYNFLLGMTIVPFVAGYYIRYSRDLTWRRVSIMAAAFTLLFFTHVMALAVALLCVGLVSVWSWPLVPQRLVRTAAACAPALLLLLIFIRASGQSTDYDPSIAAAWKSFPMHAFASSRGRAGEQALMMPAMLLYMCAGALAMRRREWISAKGPIFVAAGVLFVLYLLVPNTGFGGDEIKIRFAWSVFVLGCIAASTVNRLQAIQTPVAVYTAIFVAASLMQAWKVNVRRVSPAVTAYLEAMARIPSGSTFVRIRFPAPNIRQRYGYDEAALEPLFHVDSLAAARQKLIALSDYQALSKLFPVSLRPAIPESTGYILQDLEGTGSTGVESLRGLLKAPPVRIDYIVVLGDEPDPTLLKELNSHARLIAGNPAPNQLPVFVRVYEPIGPR